MAYHLPTLAYAYDALEPHIDAKTMEIHHTRHHQTYINNLNAAIAGTAWEKLTVEELLSRINEIPAELRNTVILAQAIEDNLGGFDTFKLAFTKAALSRFGSGWAWLSVTPDKQLIIENTGNQDSPLMHGNTPILGLDVWEHAYYLNYQNRRPDYIGAFYNVINWEEVSQRYQTALDA